LEHNPTSCLQTSKLRAKLGMAPTASVGPAADALADGLADDGADSDRQIPAHSEPSFVEGQTDRSCDRAGGDGGNGATGEASPRPEEEADSVLPDLHPTGMGEPVALTPVAAEPLLHGGAGVVGTGSGVLSVLKQAGDEDCRTSSIQPSASTSMPATGDRCVCSCMCACVRVRACVRACMCPSMHSFLHPPHSHHHLSAAMNVSRGTVSPQSAAEEAAVGEEGGDVPMPLRAFGASASPPGTQTCQRVFQGFDVSTI
jgi:hypothetical protein